MQPGLTLIAYGSSLLIGFVNITILLWLQVRSYRRHRSTDFLLLVLSSVAGVAYFALTVYASVFLLDGAYAPPWTYPTGVLLLLATAILGLTGTAKLFHAFRTLSDAHSAK